MKTGNCRIELVEGVSHNKNRAIAFLECDEIEWVNATDAFHGLRKNEKMNLMARFDHYLSGANYPRYFHGWSLSQYGGKYVSCFVFKLPAKSSEHRFYGFLEHPFRNPRTVLCVLAMHAWKSQWRTDEIYLKHLIQLKNDAAICKVIKNQFFRI